MYTIEELIDERNRELYDAIVQEIPIVLQESGDDGWAAIIRDGRLSWASPMYNIAKAGVYKFTRDLAAAMIGHGIYVNSVSPGWSMDTDFAKVPDKKAAEEMFNPYFAPFHSL
ncbi:MAG: SDR family oxidoreductase [Syntrophorhabdales bacterium]